MKTAIITGITGQTGSYLAEILLDKGYKVYGLRRRSSVFNTERIDHILKDPHIDDRLELVYGDLADYASIVNVVSDVKPDLFFNEGAQSFVRVSFEIPEYTADVSGVGVIRCLEAIRKFSPKTRFLQASTSELFGNAPAPQSETTPMIPRSPYGCAKLLGYSSVVNYREAYGLFTANSISFNHESKRRGEVFITRKVTRAATRIKLGLQDYLWVGNTSARRNWNHCKDICEAKMLIIESDSPDDYVIGTEETHSVQELIEVVFEKLDLDWEKYVKIDERYLRPSEVENLSCDASKIRNKLGWKPKYTFDDLVTEMVQHDLELARNERLILDNKI